MRSLLVALLLLTCAAPRADTPLPDWETLIYTQKSFWVTATSRLDLRYCENTAHWCLSARNSIADNVEAIEIVAKPGGQLLERRRESAGSNKRRKRWHYQDTLVSRERLEPTADGWEVTSRGDIAYPDTATPITDALLLLALATPGETRSFVVQGDRNFYRVEVTDSGQDLVVADSALGLSPDSREVDLVTLRAKPLLAVEDKNDFSLLGLSGDITLAWDRSTGLPLQLRGRAPRLGNVALNLKQFIARDTAP